MKNYLLVLTTIGYLLICQFSYSQDGAIDPTFNPSDIGFGYGDGASGTIHSLVIQSDGKILIGGYLTAYNDIPVNYITRINSNGTIDNDFHAEVNAHVNSIALQSDGKILIGGNFTQCNGAPRNKIVRLNNDGTLDDTFNSGLGANYTVMSVIVQTNGKIVITGDFTTYNGVNAPKIARINPNGSLDNSFNVGTGPSSTVLTAAVQNDGRIVIGGYFQTINGVDKNRIARLNTNGTIDNTFSADGVNDFVAAITIQPNGKIIMGGNFTMYGESNRNRLIRLNQNGTIDNSFIDGWGLNGSIRSIVYQSDGKLMIGGEFSSYNGIEIRKIARIMPNGESVDETFQPDIGFNDAVTTVGIDADGNYVLGGMFDFYDGKAVGKIAKLYPNAQLDVAFNKGSGANKTIYTTAIAPGGNIFIAGLFNLFNGEVTNRIAKLSQNGELDTSFYGGAGNYIINDILVQNDQKIIIGGDFSDYNEVDRNNLARLNADGSIDQAFDVGSGTDGVILAMALQPDGKIIIVGTFNSYNGTLSPKIARINIDGSIDNTFISGFVAGEGQWVGSIVIQSNGKLMIGGTFYNYEGVPRKSIVRIHSNGMLDHTFDATNTFHGEGFCLGLLSDGKIIVGGYFLSVNNPTQKRFARLNTDGSIDTSFNPVFSTDFVLSDLLIQPDGKILVSGMETLDNHVIIRLNTDGSIDHTFDTGDGINGVVYKIALQQKRNIIIVGNFTSYNGIGKNRIARIQTPSLHIETYGEGFSVFPNPSNGVFTVSTESTQNQIEVKVYSMFGDLIYHKQEQNTNSANIDIRENGSGMYILRINEKYIHKIIMY